MCVWVRGACLNSREVNSVFYSDKLLITDEIAVNSDVLLMQKFNFH